MTLAWEMDREEYIQLKKEGFKDTQIARKKAVHIRTLDRWKEKEGIVLGINGKKIREMENNGSTCLR